MMTIDEIKTHNQQYYDEESMNIWKSREVLTIEGVLVPQYIYKGTVDSKDHSTRIYKHISASNLKYKNKKFLDIGSCAGINNIFLTKEGFNVVGLDNSIYSLNASLYTMDMNNVYYPVYLGDHNDIEKMDYDVLLINQMDYIPDFVESIIPILEREQQRGREAIITASNPAKWNKKQ